MVFAKAPQPGSVKTRLIPLLGAEGAAALHARLTKRALATARAAAVGPVELACAPDTAHPFFRHCAEHYGAALAPQGEGDLGARMLAASERGLAAGTPVILIGCDCPALTPAHLRAAARALGEGVHAVLAPAEDGGYVLIGLARTDAALFRDIDWGEAGVMAATRHRLAALGWRWQALETLWDVDRPADYERLIASGLMESPKPPAHATGSSFVWPPE
jgi:uncharacterized protein